MARVADGIFASVAIIAWRVQLNAFSNDPVFDSVNDSYVASQNAGRLLGPVCGGIAVSYFGLSAIFFLSALLYCACILLWSVHRHPIERAASTTHTNISFADLDLAGKSWKVILVHHIEFACLGLWLAGWPIFATEELSLTKMEIGYAFSVSAAGGLSIFLVKRWLLGMSPSKKLTLSLALLLLQPLSAVTVGTQPVLWIGMTIGGLGSSIYFSTFHGTLSTLFPREQIPLVYGLFGSTTFIAQAAGQFVTPYLQESISNSFPIYLDLILLCLSIVFLLTASLKCVR